MSPALSSTRGVGRIPKPALWPDPWAQSYTYGEPGGPMGAPWWGIRAPDGIPGRWGGGWGGVKQTQAPGDQNQGSGLQARGAASPPPSPNPETPGP